jgi:hypothetical protein
MVCAERQRHDDCTIVDSDIDCDSYYLVDDSTEVMYLRIVWMKSVPFFFCLCDSHWRGVHHGGLRKDLAPGYYHDMFEPSGTAALASGCQLAEAPDAHVPDLWKPIDAGPDNLYPINQHGTIMNPHSGGGGVVVVVVVLRIQ